jgi:endoglucanase
MVSVNSARSVALMIAVAAVAALEAAPVSNAIKLDHFGYRPDDTKIAVFSADPGPVVEVRNGDGSLVLTVPTDGGSIISKGFDGAPSGDTVWWVDFSALVAPGTYRLYSPSLGAQSYDFSVADEIYRDVMLAALKTFYRQRCNFAKEAQYAGAWADGAPCHMGDVHTGPAAGHADHGSRDLTGGWHDAGDYNKYVWTAVSTAVLHLLRAFEENPGVHGDGDLGIPESANGVPDILDEVRYELDWLLKMQLPGGAVLSQLHVDGWASDSPPSADTNLRYYQDPTLESGAVLAGTCALAARVFASQGDTAYANTLRAAATTTWTWLQSQGDSDVKVWAAAEIFRLDPARSEARDYVDSFHADNWSGRFFNVLQYDTQAALTYVQTAGATAAVKANMLASIGAQVNYIFATDDLYRNGMPDWSYHWGSNAMRAGYGVFLTMAARLGATGSSTAAKCRAHALDLLHFFHGQNPLNMVYLTNMSALGGEHSSYQLYHAWFGDSSRNSSLATFIGRPPGVVEPDYPYFTGTDNHGVSDDKTSALGPAPGFVPGGPNASYSGTATPPGGETYWNRFYRDWCDQTVWTAVTWEITENSIGYQGPYVALAAAFASPTGHVFSDGFEDGGTSRWSQTVDN